MTVTTPSCDELVRRVIVLGSTGSIGVQTLEVIANLNAQHAAGRFPVRHEVVALAAGARSDTLVQQAAAFGVSNLALAHAVGAAPVGINLRTGADAAERLVREVDADLVVAAMVGSAGLPATLAAIELGRDVALANKETLVAAGELVIRAARERGVRLLPIDSEHSAMWQALPAPTCPPCALGPEVRRIIVTASGGPFRDWPADRIANATPDEALAHPTWKMGAKITVDCASLTNKALEVIETHWLFGLPGEQIEVVVHPQSIVHSFVEFADGSVVAQLGAPDMRTPIQYALTWPHRAPGVSRGLDFTALGRFDFEPPDVERFPALGLAYDVIERGGISGAVFNAANEAAVGAFLGGRIGFGAITGLARAALDSIVGDRRQTPIRDLDDVLGADRESRRHVEAALDAGVPTVTTRTASATTATTGEPDA